MAGVKGRSGTNKGKDKPWADALRLVVFRDNPEGKRRLLAIAEKCAAAAEEGDMQAIKEIGDRLDGKPAQESTVHVNHAVAAELSDNELADIAVGSGEGTDTSPVDPTKLN